MPLYNPATVEPKWQRFWEENATFATPRLPQDSQKVTGEKLYVLDMFPYPSGEGLHVGHPEGYTATDIFCRHWRMRGKTVLHPMGFDAFGLPAEEYAIKNNEQPRGFTEKNIATFVRQLKSLGFSYDWSRQLATTDVEYFRWTQWIFLVLFDTWFDEQTQKGRPIAELPIPGDVQKQGEAAVEAYRDERRLAFQSHAPVNWCPDLGTVLANEEVIDGKSERGGYPVQRIPLRQWMLKITAYADRLEKDLETVDWPESVKALQRNWIGKSLGAEVDFFLPGDCGPDAGTKAFESWKAARKQSGFPRKAGDDALRVYTTRPDTLFGATYMVLAPEHPLVDRLTTTAQRGAVEDYRLKAGGKSDLERTELAKEKTGVYTGACAINPLNGQRIPIWIADYVLISYGSGAIMAVPAHDERDCEFALKYDLPIVPVVQPPAAYEPSETEKALSHDREGATALPYFGGEGSAINSGSYDGTPTKEFKSRVAQDLEAAGLGRAATNYKLRDWLFSRQRFWGEPFPILHELDDQGEPTGRVRAVPVDQLPVDLPHLDDFKPHGRPEPPLGKSPEEWLYVTLEGKRYRRETNTMPQWAGSCWYYLRFLDPKNDRAFVDPEIEKAWMPVDLYIGGAEHAVLHLLYARFWHKVLFDRGYVSTPEPFRRLINQGMILGEMEFTGYRYGEPALPASEMGRWVSVRDVTKDETHGFIDAKTKQPVAAVTLQADEVEKASGADAWVLKANPQIRVDARSYKMSKARGNVVNPDTIVREFGADSLRLYEMFMGPLEATKPWDMSGVGGVRKFLDRSWRLIVDADAEAMTLHPSVQDVEPTADQLRVLHQTIGKVTADTETLSFNTAIARMMEFVNYFTPLNVRPKSILEPFVLLLSPYAPHLAEELWAALGHTTTLAYEPWPEYRADLAAESAVEIPVQINGKTKTVLSLPVDATKAQIEAAARADEKVLASLAGKEPTKVIVVEKGATKLVSFVVK